MDVGLAGTLLLAVAGGLTALAAAYLLLLALAALRPLRTAPSRPGGKRLAVIVPAHNEAELLPRCLASLRAQNYPANLTRIVVVADNCTDDTPAIALASGAEVMIRNEPDLRGKGRALRWATDRLLAEADPVDAVAVVDADSIAAPGLLRGLESAMAAGAEAVQGEYLVLDDGSGTATPLRQASFLLFHRTRFRGRAALGLPCSLVGNGMLLRRTLLGARSPRPRTSSTRPTSDSPGSGCASLPAQSSTAPPRVLARPVRRSGCAGRADASMWCGPGFHVCSGPCCGTESGRCGMRLPIWPSLRSAFWCSSACWAGA